MADEPKAGADARRTVRAKGPARGGTIERSPDELASLRVEVVPPDAPAEAAGAADQRPVRYYTGAEIARGGMGRVVDASDALLGRVVAVKQALTTDDESLRRFARETQITARLEHPSIVPVYDAGTAPDGSPYYVMRKVSGRPLAHLIADASELRDRLALLPHLLATAQAVAHAHGHGIIHRDLKPANILVGELGETVVIDWGLAKEIIETDDDPADLPFDPGTSLHTRFGVVFGTPGFMSPEQLKADPVDARADVYALGACLYQLLSGRPPHDDPSSTKMMDAAVLGPAPPIARVEPGVPAALTAIVDKALAYELDARYRDAGALAEDLQRFLTGQLVGAHRYTTGERIARFVRKHRVAVIAVSAAAIAAIVIAILSIHNVVVARDRADAALEQALVEKRAAETATAAANDRADELTLLQARQLVASNPTAAVALVKTLTRNPARWREVRAIAAGARAGGAAWGLPGPNTVVSLEPAPGGTRALAVGDDGIVELYELAQHTARTLDARAELGAAFLDDDHVALYGHATIALVELTTGAAHTVRRTGDLVATSRRALYQLDAAGAITATTAAGMTTPLGQLAAADRDAHWMAVSPDGNWLCIAAPAHALVADLRARAISFVPIGDAAPRAIAWNAVSTSLAIATPRTIFDVALAAAPGVRGQWPQPDPVVVAAARDDDHIYTLGVGGLHVVPRGVLPVDPPSGAATGTLGLAMTAGGTLVLGGEQRDQLRIVNGTELRSLAIPGDAVLRLATRASSHFAIAAMRGRVLVWDVDALMPERRTIDGTPTLPRLADATHAIVMRPPVPTRWIDLSTGRAVLGPAANPFAPSVLARDGSQLLVRDTVTGRIAVIRRGAAAPIELAADVQLAAFAPDGIVAGTSGGAIEQHDPAGGARAMLFAHDGAVDGLVARGGWIAAQYADGLMWRREPSGRTASRHVEDYARGGPPLQLLADGSVIAAHDRELVRWAPGGELVTIATLPASIGELDVLDRGAIVVATRDRAVFRVDRTAPDGVVSVLPPGTDFELADGDDPTLVANGDGRIDLVDLATASRWTLRPAAGGITGPTDISRDAKTLIARATTGELLVWHFALPASAAALPAWLDTLTNATAAHGPATLDWR